MRHIMESCDQGGEDQDEAWLDGPVARVKGKLEALKRETTLLALLSDSREIRKRTEVPL